MSNDWQESKLLGRTMELIGMINLTIDGKQVEVPEGKTVLQAAEMAGIDIPTLCNHSNLTPYGGCRLCMVEVEGARILQPSCTLPATNGMVVHTNTNKVKEARKFVLSLIFSERNHFCMYCQATDGDCDLQNAAYEQGLDHWPLTPNFSPYAVDGSHKYFVLDNNRCILCRRCVRACADLVGNYTLGFEERGASSILVADYGVPLGESSCISCGTCVQICPTGALIDRNSVYQGRLTDLDHHVSVCTECSVGCERDVLTRDNRLVRIDGVWGSSLNEGVLCEKGRYLPLLPNCERIYTPLIKKIGEHKAATWEEAIASITEKIKASDANSTAALASAKLPIETLALFKKVFSEGTETSVLSTVESNKAALVSKRIAEKLGKPFESKLDVLKHTDVALVIGADLVADHQVAGFFLKRQMLNEIKIILADNSINGLQSRSNLQLIQKKGQIADLIQGLTMAWNTLVHENDLYAENALADSASKTGLDSEKIKKAAKWLGEAGRPVIVIGEKLLANEDLTAIENLVSFSQKIRASLVVIKEQANSLAAAQLGFGIGELNNDLKAAFVLLGDETPPDALIKNLEKVPFLAVFATYPNRLTEKADVVLPATMWAEESGSYINTDGHMQARAQSIEAPEAVWNSLTLMQKIAKALDLNPECDWKKLISQQPASVEIAVD